MHFILFDNCKDSHLDNHEWHHATACFDLSLVLVSATINSLWPSYAICWRRSRSTLAQVIAYCLTAPNYNLNQCWLLIIEVLLHSTESNFTAGTQTIILYGFKDCTFEITTTSQWVNQTLYKDGQHFTGTSCGQNFQMHLSHLIDVTQQHGGFILRLFKATLSEVTHNCLKAHHNSYHQHISLLKFNFPLQIKVSSYLPSKSTLQYTWEKFT